ncbi:MAG: DUF5681 domain-containing protein [Candidatus Binatus sp.]|uniref:DUF5681 domain-containing protein n=1 Tax=Candidatus Binatus sp. TaxID=2811406 RepID=UPI002721BD2A|nr:DUF5681 domain-containing protein [Candidatus Binatus sp.]MDO8433560.1 DUF5681 domain-containing protein [Candidatus Binatus sp.]
MEDKDDPNYRVGYRRPPRQHQFKKGQSGNPKGRPRGSKGSKTLLRKILAQKVAVNEQGQQRSISMLEVVLKQWINKAARGDYRSIRLLLENIPALEKHLPESRKKSGGISDKTAEAIMKALVGDPSEFNYK